MKDLVGLVYNSKLTDARDLVDALVDALGLRDRCWISSTATIDEQADKLGDTSLALVVGGDGSILRTVRVITPHAIPIVGINMGRVGFMTELRVDEAVEKLPMYLNGDTLVDERMMLTASVVSAEGDVPRTTIHALNEIVVGRGSVGRLQDVTAAVDGAWLTSYRADAVIVATPTGSTGYALSAGGPIMYPSTQVILIQPVAVHTGLRDGLILHGDSVVELVPSDSEQAILVVDGFEDVDLVEGDRVCIERSSHVTRFLRARPSSSFYATITQRLGVVHRSEQVKSQMSSEATWSQSEH